jgi:hypothetical protein
MFLSLVVVSRNSFLSVDCEAIAAEGTSNAHREKNVPDPCVGAGIRSSSMTRALPKSRKADSKYGG